MTVFKPQIRDDYLEYESSEEDNQGICNWFEGKREEFYEELMEMYMNGEINQKKADEEIDKVNNKFKAAGCEPLPYFKLPLPTLSTR